MQCCLVFSAPALNLVVALFQPGWSHLLTIRSGNVAVTNLRVKIMGVVSTTKVSDIFPISQDTFQPKQTHLVINGETDFLLPGSLFPLGFQGCPNSKEGAASGTGSAFFSILMSFKKGSFGGSGTGREASSSSFVKKRLMLFLPGLSSFCGGGLTMILGLLIRIRSLSLNSLLFRPRFGSLSFITLCCGTAVLGDTGETLGRRSDEHSFALFLLCFSVIAVNSAIKLCASPSTSRPSTTQAAGGSGLR